MNELEKLILLGEKYLCQDNNNYLYHMCRMAWLAQRDGYKNEIIVACFLYRLGYLVEINSNSYCLNNKNYGKLATNYLKKLDFNNKQVIDIINNYLKIKKYNYIISQSKPKSPYNDMIITHWYKDDISLLIKNCKV